VAPDEWLIALEPAQPRTIVKVLPELAVINTISSLVVSGSTATVNWSTLPEARVTPPSKPEAVPVDTVIEVAELLRAAERIVSTEIELYNLVTGYPYFV
jgi:hypothetical protein